MEYLSEKYKICLGINYFIFMIVSAILFIQAGSLLVLEPENTTYIFWIKLIVLFSDMNVAVWSGMDINELLSDEDDVNSTVTLLI